MSISRTIRIPPQRPTAAELVALLHEYGIRRWRAAKIMHVAAITFGRYCLGPASRHAKPIPMLRWAAFKQEIAKLDEVLSGHRPPITWQ